MPHTEKVVACHDCSRLVHIPHMVEKANVLCARCGARFKSSTSDTTEKTLALAFTSLVLFILANIYPFLAMRLEGFSQETNLISGVLKLYHQNFPGLALLVLLTIFILPLFQILGLIYITLPIRLGFIPWKAASIFKTILHLQPWIMLEVYMLGILVSLIKLAKMASIVPGFAAVVYMALIVVLTAAMAGFNPQDIWIKLPVKKQSSNQQRHADDILVGCHTCSLLCRIRHPDEHCLCPRCGSSVHFRKTNSIQRTWALVIAATIFYLPANILPITVTGALGHEQADTIMSGVIYFLFSGSWHIALVIFIASVAVPLIKLVILVYLLISVQLKSVRRAQDRTRLYRLTEVVGRWSMLDVYVVTILVSLVQLGPLANIQAGPAAVYFSGVVVITMFAAESFDPRLIWDAMEEINEPKQ